MNDQQDAGAGPAEADEVSAGGSSAFGDSGGTAETAVRLRNLWVSYGKFDAVKGISLDIPKGEVFGFIGPNGAGKSSTFRVLATLQRKYRGTALVCGLDVLRQPGRVRDVMGFVPDFFGVYEDLTSLEYLHFFAAAYRVPTRQRPTVVNTQTATGSHPHQQPLPLRFR
jgi:ABC-2 type transport system ATP-binding protein